MTFPTPRTARRLALDRFVSTTLRYIGALAPIEIAISARIAYEERWDTALEELVQAPTTDHLP